MKLSDRYQYYILCEDAQMDSFINAFLKCNGISSRKRYTIPIPAGQGCGEAFVRRKLPTEIKMLHSKNYNNLAVIACTDADKLSVANREKMLIDEVKKEFPKWENKDEMLIVWIPKKEIETWIEFFKDPEVDEEMEFKHSGKPIECTDEARKMYKYCSGEVRYENALSSLTKAKDEFGRVCELQNNHRKV